MIQANQVSQVGEVEKRAQHFLTLAKMLTEHNHQTSLTSSDYYGELCRRAQLESAPSRTPEGRLADFIKTGDGVQLWKAYRKAQAQEGGMMPMQSLEDQDALPDLQTGADSNGISPTSNLTVIDALDGERVLRHVLSV